MFTTKQCTYVTYHIRPENHISSEFITGDMGNFLKRRKWGEGGKVERLQTVRCHSRKSSSFTSLSTRDLVHLPTSTERLKCRPLQSRCHLDAPTKVRPPVGPFLTRPSGRLSEWDTHWDSGTDGRRMSRTFSVRIKQISLVTIPPAWAEPNGDCRV